MAAWVGSALEFYDFSIYGTAASIVFPKLFFPDSHPVAAMVGSLATIGAAYVARPVGSLFMGHWGDKYGRKTVLVGTMLLMGFSVFAIGCLPTYGQIGVFAPIALLILRMLQGFAVSGEASGANALVLEHAPARRRGYFTSFTLSGTQGGVILASLVFVVLTSTLTQEQLMSWGWRVPFWLSLIIVVVGFIIRRTLAESPDFQKRKDSTRPGGTALRVVFADHRAAMIRVFLMIFTNAVGVTFGAFALTYATQSDYGVGISKNTMLWVVIAVNVLAVFTIPAFAALSDRIGRKPVFIGGVVCAVVMSWPFLYAISIANVPLVFATAVVMMSFGFSAYNGTWPSFWNEQFPARVRVSGVGIASQFGIALTGLLPSVAALLAPPGANVVVIVGTMIVLFTLPGIVAAFMAPETHKTSIEELDAVR
ncbi:MFS transporter [Saccharopolyspora mangrovi]|uniref:MFS transporter n=1 Tax=Saccharopolyspora mangrovi TaxID=3082379 RepID=A0ABU6ABP0_9PSEU|nr:MFS transporter [Saccharopolyspora sp. S2-29]MEB3368936.1 MFS transporter [Saccharopolyspora sp. S2-29]